MKANNLILTAVVMTGTVIIPCLAQQKASEDIKTIGQLYPGLTSGMLANASINTLPNGILLKTPDIQITQSDINDIISKQPQQIQKELGKNAFFVLEQEATRNILLKLVKKDVAQTSNTNPGKEDANDLEQFFEKNVFKKIVITDVELKTFYENNKDLCGGETLAKIGPALREYMISLKKQQMANDFIINMGKKIPIQVSDSWIKKQSAQIFDNQVDNARKSGLPSIIDFGSKGCIPCDMMAPVLETLRKKYEGKINVLFIHVGEQQILASRYGVQIIPLQVFFDKTGKELFRHTGFYAQEEIEKKMAELSFK